MSTIDTISSSGQVFKLNSCKLWYHRAATLHQVAIDYVEIRRTSSSDGIDRVALVIRATNGQEILDNLWISSLGANASPFLEHSEAVATLKHHDPDVNFIMKLVPNASLHPRYSFATKEDASRIMFAIVGRTLRYSIDVESIKSDVTHGNAFEASCETLQVWDDPSAPNSGGRVRFFRNKNPTSVLPVVEFDAKCLYASVREEKGTKTVFAFNNSQDDVIRSMKYLKIEFATIDAKETFLNAITHVKGQ